MKCVKDHIRFNEDLELLMEILDENSISYLEVLKEADERGPHRGWAYDKKTLRQYRFGCSKDLEHHKKRLTILDDLVSLGYINLSEGYLYEKDEKLKDTYSVYAISTKGKEFLRRAKQVLQSESKVF